MNHEINPETGRRKPAFVGDQEQPRFIAFTGLPGSGKDACADFLCRAFGYSKLAFADGLKEVCAALTRTDIEEWYSGRRDGYVPGHTFTYRDAMREVGSEMVRKSQLFGDNFWLTQVQLEVGRQIQEDDQTRFAISDLRFPHEEAWIRGCKQHLIIHVQREGTVGSSHSSDAGIAQQPDDVVLMNTGTLEQLFAAVVNAVASRAWL